MLKPAEFGGELGGRAACPLQADPSTVAVGRRQLVDRDVEIEVDRVATPQSEIRPVCVEKSPGTSVLDRRVLLRHYSRLQEVIFARTLSSP